MNRPLRKKRAQERLLASLNLATTSLDCGTGVLAVSLPVTELTGYPAEHFNNQADWEALIHPEDASIHRLALAQLEEQDELVCEYRIVTRQGLAKQVQAHMFAAYSGSGRLAAVETLLQPVTVQRSVMEQKFRLLAEDMTDIIVFFNRLGLVTYISPTLSKILGYPVEQLLGCSVLPYLAAGDQSRAKSMFDKLVRTKTTQKALIAFKHAESGYVHFSVHGSPIEGQGGRLESVVFVCRDMSEKIKAVQALAESEERYSRLQHRLDCFSKDLFRIVSIDQLEQRLIQEVKEVLGVPDVSIFSIHREQPSMGGREQGVSAVLRAMSDQGVFAAGTVGDLFELEEAYSAYIGVFRNRLHFLHIGGNPLKVRYESKRIWLKTMIRYVNHIFDNLNVIQDLTTEVQKLHDNRECPAWFSRFLFSLSENERKRLAHDLHDSALQEQILWFRKLDMLLVEERFRPEAEQKLKQVKEGLLDVVYQIRLICTELRPPLLKELGLICSLKQLFDATQLRADYGIEFEAHDVPGELPDEVSIHIYRIVQELLANASKHSNASLVKIALAGSGGEIQFRYEDNGIGMKDFEPSLTSMGLHGIQERARSLEGTCAFASEGRGLAISIRLPIN